MPVYYEEKEERKAFIKDLLSKSSVSIDTSCFAGYLYRDQVDVVLELEYNEYDKILKKVKQRFPRTDVNKLVKDMFSVIVKMEEEYIKAWMGKEVKETAQNYSFMEEYNPYWSDC
jgi:recombinational DNA repair protein RecT|tara:strand:+ start:319 stop:663 length:345 start_codon:yes stop_codon:yes gene_type:complete